MDVFMITAVYVWTFFTLWRVSRIEDKLDELKKDLRRLRNGLQ